jgi:hypothetical protein
MRHFDILDRRHFFGMITGLAVNIGLLKLPFGVEQRSTIVAPNREFVIVNGWVLTGEDIAASEMTRNAV